MGENDRGWMVSGFKTTAQTSELNLIGDDVPIQVDTDNDGFYDLVTRAQGSIGVSFLPKLGPDGVSVLEGFVDLNGPTGVPDGFDDDINQNNVFGRDGIDTGTPNTTPPPPFVPPPDGIPDTAAPTDFGDLVYFPIYFERLYARNETRVQGIELMRVWRRSPFRRWGLIEFFGGARYFNLRDDFRVAGMGGVLNPNLNIVPADGDYGWDPTDGSYWNTEVDNNIVGGQIGGRLLHKMHRLTFIGEVRGFAGVNFQNFDIFGRLGNGLLPGNDNQPVDLGDTAFHDSDNTTEFVPGGELRFNLNYQVTSALQLQAGWTGMYFNGLARAANSIDYRIPDMRITTEDNSQDLFVQGVTFGVEINR